MGFFSFLDPILDFLFGWVLYIHPTVAILLLAVLISLLITLAYKYMTDQDLMKRLKGEIKEFQKEMKDLKHDPNKAMAVQKKAMQTNMKYMMQSFRPTLITFIPIILVFGWMQGHLAWEPVIPGEEFRVEALFSVEDGEITLVVPVGLEIVGNPAQQIAAGKASWGLKGEAGEYFMEFRWKDMVKTKKVLITDERKYEDPIMQIDEQGWESINIIHNKMITLNLFGWKLGWLGGYLIFSIISSIALRKLFKVY